MRRAEYRALWQQRYHQPPALQEVDDLIGNAVQYGNRAAPIIVLINADSLGVVISIHYAGVSIPSRQLTTLFNSFTRGENDGAKAGGLTSNLGLGLIITKEIVMAHEGIIKVVSNEKDCTTFIVRLPKA